MSDEEAKIPKQDPLVLVDKDGGLSWADEVPNLSASAYSSSLDDGLKSIADEVRGANVQPEILEQLTRIANALEEQNLHLEGIKEGIKEEIKQEMANLIPCPEPLGPLESYAYGIKIALENIAEHLAKSTY